MEDRRMSRGSRDSASSRRWRRRGIAAAASAALIASAALPAIAAAATGTSWTVYHGNAAGSGVATNVRSVTTAYRAWTSPVLDGQIYGEPLVYAGHVFVATEDDQVYALSAANGRVVWSRKVATPVPAAALPCGNISPTVGITGTPVIDAARSEIFVVADTYAHARAAHVLVGLSTANGAVRLSHDVDPAGVDAAALLQRTGLNLDDGQVVFGMGGNAGDCGPYRGRIVAEHVTGGTPRVFTVDAAAGNREGAIWMGGAAPAVDTAGHVWVESGNGSVESAAQHYDDSDAVLELTSAMHLDQYFAPSTWPSDNATDLDLSTSPALLADGEVVAAGKDGNAFLLKATHLGGIGHQQATLHGACGNVIDGGSAVVGTTVYLPCANGPVAIRVTTSPAGLHLRWRASAGGGPPIVAADRVWTIGQNGVLYGLNPANGRVEQSATIGVPANHFPTPSIGAGLLLAASADRVVAFHAPATASTEVGAATAGAAASSGPGGGGPPAGLIAGLVAAGLGMASTTWLVRRRRGTHLRRSGREVAARH